MGKIDRRFYGDAAIPSDSLIGKMTAAAETDRASHPYGHATFVDEKGVITHVLVTADRFDEACDRIEARLGLTAQPDEPLRYARALAMARADDRRKR